VDLGTKTERALSYPISIESYWVYLSSEKSSQHYSMIWPHWGHVKYVHYSILGHDRDAIYVNVLDVFSPSSLARLSFILARRPSDSDRFLCPLRSESLRRLNGGKYPSLIDGGNLFKLSKQNYFLRGERREWSRS
jgi:hypothetical protein